MRRISFCGSASNSDLPASPGPGRVVRYSYKAKDAVAPEAICVFGGLAAGAGKGHGKRSGDIEWGEDQVSIASSQLSVGGW
jgi:hypothetical protein